MRGDSLPLSASGPDLVGLIRTAWAEVLGRADFSDDDYFFSVGGSSVGAIRVTGNLTVALDHRIPVRTLFENQTVNTLAAAVGAALAPPESPGSASMQPGIRDGQPEQNS